MEDIFRGRNGDIANLIRRVKNEAKNDNGQLEENAESHPLSDIKESSKEKFLRIITPGRSVQTKRSIFNERKHKGNVVGVGSRGDTLNKVTKCALSESDLFNVQQPKPKSCLVRCPTHPRSFYTAVVANRKHQMRKSDADVGVALFSSTWR